MLPQNDNITVQTTLGELAAAFYDEAFAVFGDRRIAEEVASELLEDALHRS